MGRRDTFPRHVAVGVAAEGCHVCVSHSALLLGQYCKVDHVSYGGQ